MNKKIKRIIAIALTVSAFCTIAPTTNLLSTKAYASTSDAQLKSIYLSDGIIDFSSSTYSYTVKVGSSVDEIRITAKPKNTNSTVEIDGTTVDDDDNYRETVSLSKGKNTIKIKVTDDEDDYTKTYILTVYRGTSSSYDDVYLKSIYLSDGNINFDKYDTSYSTSVSSSTDRITITAKPEDSYDKVRIDGSTVDDDDNYKKTVYLDKGENKIQIEVDDDYDYDDSRTYTLYINRGSSTSTNTQDNIYLDYLSVDGTKLNLSDSKTTYDVSVRESVGDVYVKAEPESDNYEVTIDGSIVDEYDNYNKKIYLDKGKNEVKIKIDDKYDNDVRTYILNINRGTVTTTTNVKSNQWVEVNGQLQYNDALGNPIKNNWFWDKSGSKYYYLNSNGNRSIGWLYNNSRWYLLDATGAMETGWKYTGGAWYYLEASGAMKTGWLNYNGAWYYLNYNGTMRTGWLIDGGKYYHLSSNGAMDHDTTISGYKLGSNGAWLQTMVIAPR